MKSCILHTGINSSRIIYYCLIHFIMLIPLFSTNWKPLLTSLSKWKFNWSVFFSSFRNLFAAILMTLFKKRLITSSYAAAWNNSRFALQLCISNKWQLILCSLHDKIKSFKDKFYVHYISTIIIASWSTRPTD